MKKLMLTSFGVLATAIAFGQSFFPENSLVVSRVNGTTNAAQSVDLVGFNYDGSSNSKTFSMGSGFTLSGSATSEGQMNASAGFLALGGYSDAVGTASVASGTTARRVAVFNNSGAGSVNYIDLESTIYTGNNIRAAYSADGTTALSAGNAAAPNGGWRSTASGVSTQLGTTLNTRVIKMVGSTIYGGTGSGTVAGGNPRGVYSLSGGTQTNVLDTGDASSPYDFELYSENSSDYFLVADDRTTAAGGGLQIWKSGSLVRTFALPATTSSLRSLAIRNWDDNGVLKTSIYGIANATKIVGFTFDRGTLEGTTSSFSELATAGAGSVYRSIEVVPEPASMAAIGLGIVGLCARRRKKA